ncbi:MAG: molybdenum cofactor guanylyltransferase [Candidatus Hydrothermarchaeota archaeon]
MRSAIILAGGKGSRLNFINKAFIKIRGRSLIEIVIENVKEVVDEVVISVANEREKKFFENELGDTKIVKDIIEDFGPLAGILTGLKNTKSEYSVVLACDMPFLNKDVIDFLFKNTRGYDAVIPKWEDDRVEPLHAVYKRESMLKETEDAVNKGFKKILVPICRLPRVKYISVNEIAAIDPELRTFVNINTLEDLKKLNIPKS